MKYPLISIITPTYNAAATFEQTIQSVINQNVAVEYIVIDGGSVDGTMEIAHRYSDSISVLLSEPDKGIYDAMNKGIDRAKGEWLYFLGGDDQLSEGILSKVVPHLEPTLAAVYGDVMYDTGDIMHSWLGYGTLIQNTLHHQATFYNSYLFNNFRYNTSYRVISDYELNLQIYLKKRSTLFIPHIIAICGSKGTSSVLSSVEVNDLRGKYVKNKAVNYVLNTMLETYYFYFKSKKLIKRQLTALSKSIQTLSAIIVSLNLKI